MGQNEIPASLVGEVLALERLLVADGRHWTILNAAALGRSADVERLLQTSPELARAVTFHGMTPLHFAAQWGHKEIVELLLSSGADPRAANNHGRTPLHMMAHNCTRIEIIELLLASGADINARDAYGNTFLRLVAECIHPGGGWSNHQGLADFLIAQGATVDLVTAIILHQGALVADLIRDQPDQVRIQSAGGYLPAGSTALHYAADRGFADVIQMLLEHGADVHARDARGRTPLYIAAHTARLRRTDSSPAATKLLIRAAGQLTIFDHAVLGNDQELVKLLEADPRLVNTCDSWGNRPLHLAAWNGKVKTVQLLAERGAELDVPNARGETPLALAVRYYHTEVVAALVADGAQYDIWSAISMNNLDAVAASLQRQPEIIHTTNRYGQTPLRLACHLGQWQIVDSLLACGAPMDLWTAASLGLHDDAARLIAGNPALVNASNNSSTPLECAVRLGHYDVATLLLNNGAATEAKTFAGETVIYHGIRKGRRDTLSLVIEHGANLAVRDNWDRTPLDVTLWRPELAPFLLAHGAPLDIFVAAAIDQSESIAQMLQAQPHLVHAADVYWRTTALHWAARSGHVSAAQVLVQHGADVNSATRWGDTPLHWSAEHGHTKVTRLLLAHGARIDVRGEAGKTPGELAAEAQHDGIVAMFAEHRQTLE